MQQNPCKACAPNCRAKAPSMAVLAESTGVAVPVSLAEHFV
jgi:hypothetical protein